MTNSSGRVGASVVSIVVLLWSALKLFRGLLIAFEEVYQSFPDTSLVGQVKKGLVTLLAVTAGIALMVAIGAALGTSAAAAIPFANLAGSLVLLVGLALVFLPLYYVLPPVDVTVREVLPGTLLATVGWIALQMGFQVYAGGSGKYGMYGILGTVLVFLTWLYFAGVLLLLGAAVNVVLSGRGATTPK